MTSCWDLLGTNATIPFGKGGPIVGFLVVQTTFLMFKNVRGWNHEQTQGNEISITTCLAFYFPNIKKLG